MGGPGNVDERRPVFAVREPAGNAECGGVGGSGVLHHRRPGRDAALPPPDRSWDRLWHHTVPLRLRAAGLSNRRTGRLQSGPAGEAGGKGGCDADWS